VTSDPLVRLLADLVAIPSVNPMGRSVAGAGYTESAIADFVLSRLKRHGLDVRVDEVAPGRPNVTALLDAGARQTMLLEAHLDTVHTGTMTVPPFDPVVRGGRLYGRGSCDTKGSLAAFMHALCSLADRKRKPRWNVLLLAAVDEEYGFTGSSFAVAHGLKAEFGIVGEPTCCAIVRAHKGVTRWRAVTRGVAAHSAYPERGENAIFAMGAVLSRLEQYAGALRRVAPHNLLGAPSLSAGVIEGGEAVNIVPARCTVELDRRTLPGESTDRVLEGARKALDGLGGWSFDEPHLSVAGMEVSEEAPAVRLLAGAITAAGGDVRVEGAQYATDAGVLNAGGIPSVVFGPGDIAQAHTSEEWIDLGSLALAASAIRQLIGETHES